MINILYTVSFILKCAPRQFDSFDDILKFIAYDAFDDQEQLQSLSGSGIPSPVELIDSLKKEFTLYPELPAIWLRTLVQNFIISCNSVNYDPIRTFTNSIIISLKDLEGQPDQSNKRDIINTLKNIEKFMMFFYNSDVNLNDVSIIDIAVMCDLLYWNEVFECLNLFFSIPPRIQVNLRNPSIQVNLRNPSTERNLRNESEEDVSSVKSGSSAATVHPTSGAVNIDSKGIIILLYRFYIDGRNVSDLFVEHEIKNILDLRTLRIVNQEYTMYDEDENEKQEIFSMLKEIIHSKIQENLKKGGSSKRWRYNNNTNNITHRKKQINKLNIVKTKRNQINPTSVNRKITIKRPHSIYSRHTHTIRKR
jgi:hypothetical protein